MSVFESLDNNPVIPVLVVEDVKHAVPLANALIEGGITALEVTLRTSAALHVVEAIAKSVPEAKVGVGTVLQPEQFIAAKNAGSAFAVSPGLTEKLKQAADDSKTAWLPGAVTASEVMRAMELGVTDLKFFPASIAGGAPALKGFSSVFQAARFCPTGGVSLDTMADYLNLPNVAAVGGSWLVTPQLLVDNNWAEITKLAKQATERAKELGRAKS